jgi:cyclophilin family peptidyl-prolyl cis-trans isomerase
MEFVTFLIIGVGFLAFLKFVFYDCNISVSKLLNQKSSNINELTDIITPPTPHDQEVYEEPDQPQNVDTPYMFMTILDGDKEIGDIVIHLYEDDVPKTARNFKELSEQKKYDGCPFHRVIQDFMIQGGDFTNRNGTGGKSIYGAKFEDENFIHKNTYGTLSMANSGPNTNGSQFFINTKNNTHLDGKHVVFGEVIEGLEVVAYLNNVQTSNDKPNSNVTIKSCGRVWLEEKNKEEDSVDDADKKKYSEYLSTLE